MRGFLHGAGWGWRRLTAGTLIYALLMQGLLIEVGAVRLAAVKAGWAGFEVCSRDGGRTPGDAPERPAADCHHCMLCPAGSTYIPGVSTSASGFRAIAFATVLWPFTPWRFPADTVDANSRPRGPPVA